jgi:signal transduction histidine kinase
VLADFISKIIEDISNSTKNTHGINVQISEMPEQIITDEKLLRNIVINLVTNAVKFSPGKKFVDLIVECRDQHMVFTVRDEGIGIPPDELKSIFEPFERGRSVGSIQGTGLGLSIVKKAIELLAGKIDITSSVGVGTIITVTIPLKNEA